MMNASVELNPTQIRELICNYFAQNGIQGVSHQDIDFVIKEVERGDQRDHWKEYTLTCVRVKNIRIGKEGI
jgi:hypothetical protein